MTGTNAGATTRSRARRSAGSLEDAQAESARDAEPLSARGSVTTAGVGTPGLVDDPPQHPEHPEPRPASTTPEPPKVPVHVALSRVMASVRAVEKNDRNNTPGASFNFRGIDAVTNALGPAMRAHGVIVLPELTAGPHYRDVLTSQGKASREVTLTARYTFVGPEGDTLSVVAPGEAMDTGDKGTAKAMSVALRIALLQTFILPTTEPDPDATSYERGTPSTAADIPGDPPPPALHPADADALAAALVGELLAAGNREAGTAVWNRITGGPIRTHEVSGLLDAETRQVLGLAGSGPVALDALARTAGAYVGANGQSVTAGVLALVGGPEGGQ